VLKYVLTGRYDDVEGVVLFNSRDTALSIT
jgi:hypothetical protein